MANEEVLAKQIAEMQDELRNIENEKGQNWMLPEPPKPGELIYCNICGKPMYPKDFSKDPKIRKREFKWQIHYACQEKMSALCDINTPGVIAERKQKQIDN